MYINDIYTIVTPTLSNETVGADDTGRLGWEKIKQALLETQ